MQETERSAGRGLQEDKGRVTGSTARVTRKRGSVSGGYTEGGLEGHSGWKFRGLVIKRF